jgi:hypothetical protein
MKMISVLVVLLLSAPVMADSMNCGNRIVVDGDRMSHVLRVCGEPDDISSKQRFVQRKDFTGTTGNKVIHEINTEYWTYTFNDGSLPKTLEFENDILIRIDAGPNK